MNEPNEKIEQMLSRLELRQPSAALDQRMADLFAQADGTVADEQEEPHSYKFKFRVWSISALAGVAALVAVAWFVNQNINNSPAITHSAQGTLIQGATAQGGGSDSQHFINPQLAVAGTPSIHVGESQIVDEGFTTTPTGDPVRVLRRQSVQRSMWVDPDTQAHVQVEVPNEEVVLIDSPTY